MCVIVLGELGTCVCVGMGICVVRVCVGNLHVGCILFYNGMCVRVGICIWFWMCVCVMMWFVLRCGVVFGRLFYDGMCACVGVFVYFGCVSVVECVFV